MLTAPTGPICPWCNREMVEVDNPMRREVRHRRGEESLCPGPPSAEEPPVDPPQEAES